MQNFPFTARVLIHFIKWMSCSGWFHSPGYYYEGYLHVRPVSVSGNHAGCAVLARHCSALGAGGIAHLPRCFIAIFIFHWPLPCCTCLLARTCFICLRLRLLLRVRLRMRMRMRLSMPNEDANGLVILNWFWLGGTHMNICNGGGFSL